MPPGPRSGPPGLDPQIIAALTDMMKQGGLPAGMTAPPYASSPSAPVNVQGMESLVYLTGQAVAYLGKIAENAKAFGKAAGAGQGERRRPWQDLGRSMMTRAAIAAASGGAFAKSAVGEANPEVMGTLTQSWRELQIVLGGPMASYIETLAFKIQDLSHWFESLDEGTQKLIARYILAGVAVATVVVAIGGMASFIAGPLSLAIKGLMLAGLGPWGAAIIAITGALALLVGGTMAAKWGIDQLADSMSKEAKATLDSTIKDSEKVQLRSRYGAEYTGTPENERELIRRFARDAPGELEATKRRFGGGAPVDPAKVSRLEDLLGEIRGMAPIQKRADERTLGAFDEERLNRNTQRLRGAVMAENGLNEREVNNLFAVAREGQVQGKDLRDLIAMYLRGGALQIAARTADVALAEKLMRIIGLSGGRDDEHKRSMAGLPHAQMLGYSAYADALQLKAMEIQSGNLEADNMAKVIANVLKSLYGENGIPVKLTNPPEQQFPGGFLPLDAFPRQFP